MPAVIFLDTEPSEKEYFEEYNKFISLFNSWFVLILLLRIFSPLCLGLLTGPFEYPASVRHFIVEFSIKPDINRLGNRSNENPHNSSMAATDENFLHDTIMRLMMFKCLGFAVGAVIGGIFGDIYGRRMTSFVASMLWLGITSYFLTLNTDTLVDALYVLITACVSAINMCSFVNFAEIATTKYRLLAIYTLPFYVLGDFVVKFIFDALKVWKYCITFVTTTVAFVLFATWYTPNSPRWLLNKNRRKKAYTQLNEMSGLLYDIQGVKPDESVPAWKIFKDMLKYLVSYKLKPFILCNILIGIASIHYWCAKMNVILYNVTRAQQFQSIENAAEFLGHLFFFPSYTFLGKRNGLLFCYVLLALENLVAMMAFDEKVQIYYNLFGVMAGIAAINFCWLYFLDIVPTFLRCTVIGCGFFMFNLTTGSTIYLLYLLPKNDAFAYHMSFFVVSLFGISTLKLPDNNHLDLPNQKLY